MPRTPGPRTVEPTGTGVNASGRFRHHVRLRAPAVGEREVVFSWEVTPATELYHRTEFTLSFPDEIELARVPDAVWWRVMMICLHAHWVLLGPCTVEVPVSIGAAEREFWTRLTANVAAQLEAYGAAPRPGGRSVLIADSGPALAPIERPSAGSRAIVAFSGGKDSLLLAALASELTDRPLLVTITSPVPWARDHVGDARERALSGIRQQLAVDSLEVRSDFRTAWDLGFPARDGCSLGTHELSDLPLYYGAMAAIAAAEGGGRCLLASEADIQYNAAGQGGTIQHREFLSSAPVQQALDALLGRFGVRQGSLTFPLHMPQVLALLLSRYPALFELQFSCWQAPPGKQACSACPKCFQIAMIALAQGVSPLRAGIDPVDVLCAFTGWRPDSRSVHVVPALHADRSSRDHVVLALRDTPTERVAAILDRDDRTRRSERRGEALAVYTRMRAQALVLSPAPAAGYVEPFLEFVQRDLREPLRAVLAEHLDAFDDPVLAAMAARSRALASWIAAPLGAART
jgi:hypothetical protein